MYLRILGGLCGLFLNTTAELAESAKVSLNACVYPTAANKVQPVWQVFAPAIGQLCVLLFYRPVPLIEQPPAQLTAHELAARQLAKEEPFPIWLRNTRY